MHRMGDGTAESFCNLEFDTLDLNDKRLDERAKKILITQQTKLTSCVQQLYTNPKDCRQTYDFYSNPKITGSKLMEPHIQKTVLRIKQSTSNYILAIQDQTYSNFTSHLAKTELGRISAVASKHSKHNQYGIIQHSTLCVDDKNEPLGLLDVQHFDLDDTANKTPSDKRSIETKKTRYWINALDRLEELLKEDVKKVITVADREGDFFEFLYALTEKKANYVIRCQHNRYMGEKYQTGEKLDKYLDKTLPLGVMDVEIHDVKTHAIKTIQITVKKLESITIPVPRWPGESSEKKNYKPIQLNVVMAYNNEYCWILLSNLEVNTMEDCQKIINIYKQRWHIEDFHKVLKTAYQIDEIYLHSSRQAIINAIVMACIAACRLYWIIFIGRVEENVKANHLFTELEWKSLYVFFKEKIPVNTPSIKEVILLIAKLGGYKESKKAKPPGIKKMWLGWQKFSVIAEMYEIVMSSKT